MKRLLSITLAFCVLITAFSPTMPKVEAAALASALEYTTDDLKKLPSEPSLDYTFLPASPKWLELVADVEPAEFKATYKLADNVVEVNKSVTDSVADMGQILSGSTVQKLQPNRIKRAAIFPRTFWIPQQRMTVRKSKADPWLSMMRLARRSRSYPPQSTPAFLTRIPSWVPW